MVAAAAPVLSDSPLNPLYPTLIVFRACVYRRSVLEVAEVLLGAGDEIRIHGRADTWGRRRFCG